MNEENHNSIREKVLERIKSGRVTMRPKWYFIILAAVVVMGIAGVLLAILYFASFTVFSLRQTGAWFVPIFGPGAWFAFFRSFPWLLLLVVALCAILLEIFMRHYSFGRRHSILTVGLGILLIAVAGGILISYTPLHRELLRHARDKNLPFGGDFYRNFSEQHLPDIFRGRIIATTTSGFILADDDGATSTVMISQATRLPFGGDFDMGGTIIVFGHSANGLIYADGVREITD